jgi:hypothetical protein
VLQDSTYNDFADVPIAGGPPCGKTAASSIHMEKTMLKHTLVAAALVATFGATAQPRYADVAIVSVPPPAPYSEVIPESRPGFVWAPGYWDWNGRRHVWVGGTWLRERPGHVYLAPEWVQRNGRWMLDRGAWVARHDRDRDGIPNRYDRDRDNDGVANRYDRDRDGDGVPNHRDAYPNNPYRS